MVNTIVDGWPGTQMDGQTVGKTDRQKDGEMVEKYI